MTVTGNHTYVERAEWSRKLKGCQIISDTVSGVIEEVEIDSYGRLRPLVRFTADGQCGPHSRKGGSTVTYLRDNGMIEDWEGNRIH